MPQTMSVATLCSAFLEILPVFVWFCSVNARPSWPSLSPSAKGAWDGGVGRDTAQGFLKHWRNQWGFGVARLDSGDHKSISKCAPFASETHHSTVFGASAPWLANKHRIQKNHRPPTYTNSCQENCPCGIQSTPWFFIACPRFRPTAASHLPGPNAEEWCQATARSMIQHQEWLGPLLQLHWWRQPYKGNLRKNIAHHERSTGANSGKNCQPKGRHGPWWVQVALPNRSLQKMDPSGGATRTMQ